MLKYKDIQALIHWILDPTTQQATNPPWIMVQNRQNVSKVVCLLIDDLGADEIYSTSNSSDTSFRSGLALPSPLLFNNPTHHHASSELSDTTAKFMAWVQQVMDMGVITQTPGDKYRLHHPLRNLLETSLPKPPKPPSISTPTPIQPSPSQHDILIIKGLEHYVLTLDEMQQCDFHLHPITSSDWLDTASSSFHLPTSSPPYDALAIDCEMCYTQHGLELTRISIISPSLDCLYDTYVRPLSPILDYNTHYSGITPSHMANTQTTLTDVHHFLRQIMTHQTILVGHGLQNDLRVLKMRHRRVVDTSWIYDSSSGKPFKPKLKYLADKYLGIRIQDTDSEPNQQQGHDSVTDATATMKLALLKVDKGAHFGLVRRETESLFDKLQRLGHASCLVCPADPSEEGGSREYGLSDAMKSGCVLKYPTVLDDETQNDLAEPAQLTCLLDQVKHDAYKFVLCQFPSISALTPHLSRLQASLPHNTCLIMVSSSGAPKYTEPMRQIQKRRYEYQRLLKEMGENRVREQMPNRVVGEEELAQLEVLVSNARLGMCFVGMIR